MVKQLKRIAAVVVSAGLVALGVGSAAAAAPTKPAPKSCTRALDAGEEAFGVAGVAFYDISKFGQQESDDALQASTGGIAGVTPFLQSMTSNMQDMVSKLTPLQTQLTEIKSRYNSQAAKCRRGSS
jgi:hypothetical protein